MTKAFMIRIKEQPRSIPIQGIWQSGSAPSQTSVHPGVIPDSRPILVIAKTIDEAASRYKNASSIEELDVKDIIIDEHVDIIIEGRINYGK